MATRLVTDPLTHPQVIALLELHLAGMRASSPVCSVHALDLDALRADSITFWSVWEEDQLMGFGALSELSPTHGELKSMRTTPAALGKGVGGAVLQHAINVGRVRGYERISLETGTGEAFDAAHHLYQRTGFQPCGPFGTYTNDPFSRFYTLDLAQTEPRSARLRGGAPSLVSTEDGRAVHLHQALLGSDATDLVSLLERDPFLATDRFGDATCSRTALHALTDHPGHLPDTAAKIQVLVAHGADVNAKFIGTHTETPLHWAASSDDVEAIDTLLDFGADIEADGGVLTSGSPLDDAVIFGQWAAARRLVERGAKVQLFHAAGLGMLDQVHHLAPGADAQHRQAALWHAANAGHLDCARALITVGADPNAEGFDGLTPQQAAVRAGISVL